MTLREVFRQAQALSLGERKELAKLLIDTLDSEAPIRRGKTGAEIVAMLESMPPIEFVDNEIEDPVEWLRVQRAKRAARLQVYWDVEGGE